MPSDRQYLRHAQVIVGKAGTGLLIENLRVSFEVVKDSQSAPNEAIIKIYNLNDEHQRQIRFEFEDILLNAGYLGSEMLVFRGNIKHVYRYRDKLDWITEVVAGDGDSDYRNSTINQTFAAGTSDAQMVDRICGTFKTTKKGAVQGVSSAGRARGKVVSGNNRGVLHNLARQNNCNWSIQDGQLQIIPVDGVLDTEAFLINEDTGMLGAPEQDDKGIKIKTKLNPLYQINGRVKLDNNNIKLKKKKISEALASERGSSKKTPDPVRLDPDGVYKIYKLTHKGDTHGTEWVSEIETVGLDSVIPPKGKK